MTLTERDFAMLPQKEGIPPPVNNLCVPDIFNKLDADVIERTRVLNSQLNVRLNVQERVIVKYKSAAEQRYKRERARVCKDLRSIVRRLPNYSEIPQLETKINKLKKRKRRSNLSVKHNCVHTTEPLDMKGLAEGKEDKPYCGRYFSHHLPTKSKFYKDVLPSVRKGESAPELRPRPTVGIQNVFPLRPQNAGLVVHKRLPTIHSMDDTFVHVPTKSYCHLDDDDDTKTV